MKLLFAISLIAFSLNCISQTKTETEDWLLFNLDKYYSSNLDYRVQNHKIGGLTLDRINAGRGITVYLGLTWDSYVFNFKDGKLIIDKFSYEMDSSNRQIDNGHEVYRINLKRIIKVETEINRSDSLLRIIFKFKRPEYDAKDRIIEQSVESYDVDNKKYLNAADSYKRDYYIEAHNSELMNNNMGESFKKAFEYIVKFNGGKIISDTF